MELYLLKLIVSVSVIVFCSWFSAKRPDIAGFIVALPLSTLLVLAFSHVEYHRPEVSFELARSIFAAVPLTLLFFVPFLLAPRFRLSFWSAYSLGIVFLAVGYGIHQRLMGGLLR